MSRKIQATMRMDSPGIATATTHSKQTTNSCLGIRVRFDASLEVIVDSRGVWLWKEIVVGPVFWGFPAREQQALLLHEVGHCKMNHVAKLVWFILKSPARLRKFISCAMSCAGESVAEFHSKVAKKIPEIAEYRQAQEFEADRFAQGCGYGADLISAFARIKSEGGPFHPNPALRVARLLGVG